jgi:hypothetical protein
VGLAAGPWARPGARFTSGARRIDSGVDRYRGAVPVEAQERPNSEIRQIRFCIRGPASSCRSQQNLRRAHSAENNQHGVDEEPVRASGHGAYPFAVHLSRGIGSGAGAVCDAGHCSAENSYFDMKCGWQGAPPPLAALVWRRRAAPAAISTMSCFSVRCARPGRDPHRPGPCPFPAPSSAKP